MCMSTPLCFPPFFSKEDNFCDFLFTFMDHETLPEGDQLLEEKNLLPLRVYPCSIDMLKWK